MILIDTITPTLKVPLRRLTLSQLIALKKEPDQPGANNKSCQMKIFNFYHSTSQLSVCPTFCPRYLLPQFLFKNVSLFSVGNVKTKDFGMV